MTKSPGTHVEPLAAAAQHGEWFLPPARYRHAGDVIRLIVAGLALGGALAVTFATHATYASATAVTALQPSTVPAGHLLAARGTWLDFLAPAAAVGVRMNPHAMRRAARTGLIAARAVRAARIGPAVTLSACIGLIAMLSACTSAGNQGSSAAGKPSGRHRYGPRLSAVLNAVSARLTTTALRAMEARTELNGQDPRRVAASWLRAEGLING